MKVSFTILEDKVEYVDLIMWHLEDEYFYRNIDLDQQMLANRVGVSDKCCVKCIREHTGLLFFAFLNEFRIRKIIELLDSESNFRKPSYYFDISRFYSRNTFDRYLKRKIEKNIITYIDMLKIKNECSIIRKK